MGLNKPVDFTTAKLLKEKGYDKRSEPYRYNKNGEITLLEGINAPTIAEVVMWLYEKHGIWIEVKRVVLGSDEWGFSYVISYLPKEYSFVKRRSPYLVNIESFKEGIGSYIGAWDEPQEAYQAAIDYTLNNLI